MACKGICNRFKAKRGDNMFGRYADGQKRCQICEIWFKTVAIYCQCCGVRLRGKPRNTRYKEINQQAHLLGYLIDSANRGR